MRLPAALLVSALGAISVTHPGCSSQGCSTIGCGDEGYEIFFDPDSRWGQGVHTLKLYWGLRDSEYQDVLARCRIYPYFTGRNAECEPIAVSSAQIRFSDQSLLIRNFPDYLRITIEDEGGWSINQTLDVEYEVTTPGGPGCDECQYGSTTLKLEGPGELAGYVQDLYAATGGAASELGAGGLGGSPPGDGRAGTRCAGNQNCALPGFCFSHFLGGEKLCTQSCLQDTDCPNDSVCTSALIDDSFERIDGYCMQPCSDVAACEPLGSHCNVQDAGHFCF